MAPINTAAAAASTTQDLSEDISGALPLFPFSPTPLSCPVPRVQVRPIMPSVLFSEPCFRLQLGTAAEEDEDEVKASGGGSGGGGGGYRGGGGAAAAVQLPQAAAAAVKRPRRSRWAARARCDEWGRAQNRRRRG